VGVSGRDGAFGEKRVSGGDGGMYGAEGIATVTYFSSV